MSSLGVVPDFIASFHSNPLRNGTILLLFLGQESLDPESLVRRHGEERTQPHIGWRRREERFCFFLLSTALLSGTTGCSRSTLCAPFLELTIFLKGTDFFYWKVALERKIWL